MADFLILGRRRVSRRYVALAERYEPDPAKWWHRHSDLHSRVVLLNRDSLLIGEPVRLFARQNGFPIIAADLVALNPEIAFEVSPFLADERFIPSRAYASRLSWRDEDGNAQSKLLLSYPEAVEAVLSECEAYRRSMVPALSSAGDEP